MFSVGLFKSSMNSSGAGSGLYSMMHLLGALEKIFTKPHSSSLQQEEGI